MSVKTRSNIVTDGLTLFLDAGNFKSYPKSGTLWNDLGGSGYNCTLTNGPTFSATNGGNIVFDGSNDYANFTTYSQPSYTTTTNFTWDIWVLINSGQVFYNIIMGNRIDSDHANYNFCKLTPSGFEYASGAGVQTTSYTPPTNVWGNICIVKNGTSITYYYNIRSVATGTASLNFQSTAPFYLGGDPSVSEWAKCSLASVRIYNRNLSLSEIYQNYNTQKYRFGL